jgi:hypothetical protein
LIALSEGRCYYPDCLVPVVDFVDDKPFMNVDVAHIYALANGGPRGDETLPGPERNLFSNLLLLCRKHHRAVDQDMRRYTPEVLLAWKTAREDGEVRKLGPVSGLSETRLEELIGKAFQRREEQLDQAIVRLAEVDRAAARWMIQLREEIETLRRRPVLDEGVVRSFAQAVKGLRLLDEGVINKIAEAARDLKHLEESSKRLDRASTRLRR